MHQCHNQNQKTLINMHNKNQKRTKKTLRTQKTKKKTILGDFWLDPPKSEKPKNQKNLGKIKKKQKKQKKQFSETLGWTPLSSRLPQNCFFLFFRFFWFSQGFFGFLILLILGGPSKSLSECCFLFFVFSRFFGLASELTSHLKASVLFAYI